MVEKLDEMEDKLNEQIKSNIALNQRLAESVADTILSDVCEGLALSQKEKLASLAENVEFDSEDNYREKLVALKESYFPSNAGTLTRLRLSLKVQKLLHMSNNWFNGVIPPDSDQSLLKVMNLIIIKLKL